MTVDDHVTGVLLPRDLPADRVLDFAREAERFGFGELWVVEDLGFRGGVAQAGAVLAATDRIRVGIGVLPVGARGVAFAAMEAATLAELFPGRVDIGVGHGMPDWMRQVGAWPASPLALLEEYTVALRALLRGERVDVAGRHVRLDGVRLETPPAVPPPVLAGVRGPRSLAVAGRVAEGTVLAEPVSPEYVRSALGSIAARGPHRVVGYNLAVVHDDEGAAVAAVRPALAPLGEPDWRPHLAPLPFADEVIALRAGCADGGEFARRLPAEWVRHLAVVGTPAQARRRVEVLHEAGVTSTVLIPVGGDPFVSLASLARAL